MSESELEFCAAQPVEGRVVFDPVLARGPHGVLWVAWRFDDEAGPEGGIAVRAFGDDGVACTSELVAARGSKGEFELGGMTALPKGGAALAWRGEEGMAWVMLIEPRGRTQRVSFLEPCEGPPAIASESSTGEVFVALARSGGGGVVAGTLSPTGSLRTRFEGPAGSDSPAAASGAGGYGVVYRTQGALEVVHGRGIHRIARPTVRAVPHAPAIAKCGRDWACAWISEDTGRFSMLVARPPHDPVRLADVWTPLERARASAPALAARDSETLALAWREERGPRPGVYLRPLDREGRQRGREVRVSAREGSAVAGRVALCAGERGRWVCAFAERRGEAGAGIFVKHLREIDEKGV